MSRAKIIHVVGGVYSERCLLPSRHDIYGSGGRAAAVIATLGGQVRLSTYLDADTKIDFDPVAAAHHFAVVHRKRPHPITFGYTHPLSHPEIMPPRNTIRPLPKIRINHSEVLRFGMLESDAVVTAKRAVYDVQDLHSPHSFRDNGSTAKELALIVNLQEARLLAKGPSAHTYEALSTCLAEQERAVVVILKLGPRGLFVRAADTTRTLGTFQTDRVWKIGSGDVFSAAFAYHWMLGGRTALDAVREASLATARYCDTGDIASLTTSQRFKESPFNSSSLPNRLIYLAGPFFTTGSRWLITEARRYFRDGSIPVFSPYHDVGVGSALEVAPKDIDGIKRCTAMLAFVDGSDAGTLFEIGYARALNKPVVALAENPNEEDLKMLRGSGCIVVTDLAAALYRVTSLHD